MGSSVWHAACKSLLVGFALSGIFWGCSYFEKPVQPESAGPPTKVRKAPGPQGFVHSVQWPGESLSLIAKWYTGSSSNWGALAKANPKLNPDLIRIGDKIIIPQGIIKNQEPMPRSFLSSSSPKEDQTISPPAPKETEPKETEPKKVLYAPI